MSTITVLGPMDERYDEILTPEALRFLALLHDRFAGRRADALHANSARRKAIANGRDPRFLPETANVRNEPSWQVAGAGPGLEDRRVEITGPTDRKMAINALNSGAKVWLADHEDALSPTWVNIIEGQLTLLDAAHGHLAYTSPEGKQYRVRGATPTIVFRPRGWHLTEKHLCYTDTSGRRSAASASLVDFGLHVFHTAIPQIAAGRGPYYYLPKLEGYHEARLWDDVFTLTENHLGIDHGTIRATVLIETITAAFEMEEILWELRDHCAGLNAGRWDYLFSIIKNFRSRGGRWVLPDRSDITMTAPFMRAYTTLLVQTCHRRGAYAIGGMSAFIPDRRDPERTRVALEKVTQDKRREAGDGFDGTWVAHPGLIEVAQTEFDAVLGDRPNQLTRTPDSRTITAKDILDVASAGGDITDEGVRTNVSVALRYLESWLRGIGAAAIDGLMEDAATAEISRAQLRQWMEHRVVTTDGTEVTGALIDALITTETASLMAQPGSRADDAAETLRGVTLQEDFPPFLTVQSYALHLVEPRPVVAA